MKLKEVIKKLMVQNSQNACECMAVLLLMSLLMSNAINAEAKGPEAVAIGVINAELKTEMNPAEFMYKAEKVALEKNLCTTTVSGGEQEWAIMADPEPVRGFPQYAGEVSTLAIAIECEAGKTAELSDRIYTGSVIINRAEAPADNEDFGNVHNLWEVIHQRGQYYSATVRAVNQGKHASPEAWYVAQGLIDGTIPCLESSILYQMDEQPGGRFGASLVYVQLPNSCQYYAIPRNFYGDNRYDGVYSTTSEVYPLNE